MDDHIKQALEIVKAQASFRAMTEEEMSSMIRTVATAIKHLTTGATDTTPVVPEGAVKQVLEKSISCLECGKSFRLITRRHLLSHGLTVEEYKAKWDYPKDMPLACKGLQRERRKKMKDMKLWERRRKKTPESQQ